MSILKELREKQDSAYTAMQDIRKVADAKEGDQKGSFDAEQRSNWDKLNKDYDDAGKAIETHEGDIKRQAKMDEMADERNLIPDRKTSPDDGGVKPEDKAKQEQELRTVALRKFISHGQNRMSGDELRALQADSDTAGGTLKPSELFVADLIKKVDDFVFIRQLATKFSLTSADSLGVPTLENDPADADWTVELAIGGEDSTMDFGKRALTPQPLGKLLKVSEPLLRRSAIPVDNLVRDRLAYKFAITEEKAFLTGTGANQPLGVFTADANGISTARDVSTGNSNTAIAADGLIEAKYSLKAQYMNSQALRWLFHRDAIKNIRKLKDGNGDYLWIRGLAGAPDSILEVPYMMSEYVPNTFTSGLYVGMIADFSHYWIADALSMTLKRLDELYAANNQVGFIGRLELDGMPVLEEAFARVTLT